MANPAANKARVFDAAVTLIFGSPAQQRERQVSGQKRALLGPQTGVWRALKRAKWHKKTTKESKNEVHKGESSLSHTKYEAGHYACEY